MTSKLIDFVDDCGRAVRIDVNRVEIIEQHKKRPNGEMPVSLHMRCGSVITVDATWNTIVSLIPA